MTKICVTSQGDTLDATVNPRFGRCAYFMIVDTGSMQFRAVPNGAASATGGAGIQAAQIVASEEVDAVITGSVGPNAYSALQSAGVRIMATSQGNVRNVVELYKNGSLGTITTPGPSHRGLGAGTGRGGGRGRGGGGRGGRRGGY
ncbi:MAG: NifB/NifX family molybdenum-iron cluster-binding protein [Candidatus Thorarchaeota archaeon]